MVPIFHQLSFQMNRHRWSRKDPEQAYDKLIRPLKCKLGLIYAENQNFFLDCYLIVLTLLAIINKNKSMDLTKNLLINLNCEDALLKELFSNPVFHKQSFNQEFN